MVNAEVENLLQQKQHVEPERLATLNEMRTLMAQRQNEQKDHDPA